MGSSTFSVVILRLAVATLVGVVAGDCSIPQASSGTAGFPKLVEYGRTRTECRVVMLSCALGSSDHLRNLTNMRRLAGRDTCFVYVTDTLTLTAEQGREGCRAQRDGEDVCGWDVVLETQLPFVSPILNSRVPKMLMHLFFPHAAVLVWVDGNKNIRTPLRRILAAYLRDKGTDVVLTTSLRGARTVADEARFVRGTLAPAQAVDRQMAAYRQMGYDKLDVYHGGFRIQRNSPRARRFGCLWFSEVLTFTARDQLSLAAALHMADLRASPRLIVVPKDDFLAFVHKGGHASGRSKAWHGYARSTADDPDDAARRRWREQWVVDREESDWGRTVSWEPSGEGESETWDFFLATHRLTKTKTEPHTQRPIELRHLGTRVRRNRGASFRGQNSGQVAKPTQQRRRS